MLEQLWTHKYKIMLAVGLVVIFLITYLTYREYEGEFKSCESAGGSIVFDPKNNKIYCDRPYRAPEPKRGYWIDEILKDIFGY